jgi:tetratricopeptide (TPR) repeat protein
VANAHDSLGEIYTFTGRYEEAEQEFRAALELQSDFYASLVNLARIYIAQGRVEKGLKIMHKTGELLEGSDVELRFLYMATQTFITHWMPEELERVATRFIQLYPDEGYAATLRIFLTTFDGELDKAKALTDSLVTSWRTERFPRLTDPAKSVYESFADRFAAMIAHYEGRPEAAAAAWEEAVAHAAPLAPHELISYRVPYAMTLAALGRNLDALAQAQEVLQTNPRVVMALVIQAQSLLALNEIEKAAKALKVLDKALAVADPDYPPVALAKELEKELNSRSGS